MINSKDLQHLQDPYQLLGIPRQASDEEIKRAYFQRVREYPPEREPERFRAIRTAYELLRDPQSREQVDLLLLQPPPQLPNRRSPSYDLAIHAEALWSLAAEVVVPPMDADFDDPIHLMEMSGHQTAHP
ncbi:MAG: hypothetical protein KatS3mg050_5022 [Litorilinea sp.]|nr:MAG: hypothetical protein KatS3mg050_5022 [Litorilinea sp.]